MRRILTLFVVPAMLALAACNSGGSAGSARGGLPTLNPLLTEAMPAVVNVQVSSAPIALPLVSLTAPATVT